MQTVIGRLTADAKIAELTDGRKVVNFTIAHNDRFKPKGSDEVKQVTTYYNCAYWIGTGIAAHLTKGTLIETGGRIGVNAWNNLQREARASLTLHANYIDLLAKVKNNPATEQTGQSEAPTKDDLPF